MTISLPAIRKDQAESFTMSSVAPGRLDLAGAPPAGASPAPDPSYVGLAKNSTFRLISGHVMCYIMCHGSGESVELKQETRWN